MLKEGQVRIPSGCAISAMFSKSETVFTGEGMIRSIATMHERSNGLGGGFAGYGIYPEYKDFYAFHLFYDSKANQKKCENYLKTKFNVVVSQEIPTKESKEITDTPIIWRYFLDPLLQQETQETEWNTIAQVVLHINTTVAGSYVFSSGKNMGTFKGVGFPEDIGRFYRLDEYEGYCFTAHGRYPTNTPGWWGGAHPFSLLNYSVVHNGEISSYDANRRSIEMYGYQCTLQTDTEVITYMIDYLHRKVGLSLHEVAHVLAAPFWETIEKMPKEEADYYRYLRNAFAAQLITGPFSILVGFEGGLMALNDRLKLRSMVVGETDDITYIASEEAAIRVLEPNLTKVWAPKGGEAVVLTNALYANKGGMTPC